MATYTQPDAFIPVVPYASVAYADGYFSSSFAKGTAWAAFTEEQRLAALRQATTEIDTLYFIGTKAVDGQLREFPRSMRFDMGFDDEFPPGISNACCEQAYYIAVNVTQGADHEARRDHQDQGLSSISREGSVENYDLPSARRTPITPPALDILRSYIAYTTNLQDPR